MEIHKSSTSYFPPLIHCQRKLKFSVRLIQKIKLNVFQKRCANIVRNALVITCRQCRGLSVTSWGSTHSRPAAQSLNCISFVDGWSWPVTHQQTKYPLCCESPEHKHQQTVPPLPTKQGPHSYRAAIQLSVRPLRGFPHSSVELL